MDIFEKIKNVLGCEYISDLRFVPRSSRAKNIIKDLDLDVYSFAELNDLVFYLYGETQFKCKEEVIRFLESCTGE